MPCAPACLRVAIFALSFGLAAPDLVAAPSGARHSNPMVPALRTGHGASPAFRHHPDLRRKLVGHHRHLRPFWLGGWPYWETIGDTDAVIVDEGASPAAPRM